MTLWTRKFTEWRDIPDDHYTNLYEKHSKTIETLETLNSKP